MKTTGGVPPRTPSPAFLVASPEAFSLSAIILAKSLFDDCKEARSSLIVASALRGFDVVESQTFAFASALNPAAAFAWYFDAAGSTIMASSAKS